MAEIDGLDPAGVAILHPARMRIVMALGAGPLTPQQLHDRLPDIPQASLYRHVARLKSAGVIEVVDSNRVRGTVERTYGLVETVDAERDEDQFAAFTSFLGLLMSDLAAVMAAGDSRTVWEDVGYRQVGLWLDDDEMAAFVAELGALIGSTLRNHRTPERRRRLVTTIVMPDARARS